MESGEEITGKLIIPIIWIDDLIENYIIETEKAFDDGRRTQGHVYAAQVDLLEKIKEKFTK